VWGANTTAVSRRLPSQAYRREESTRAKWLGNVFEGGEFHRLKRRTAPSRLAAMREQFKTQWESAAVYAPFVSANATVLILDMPYSLWVAAKWEINGYQVTTVGRAHRSRTFARHPIQESKTEVSEGRYGAYYSRWLPGEISFTVSKSLILLSEA